MILAGGPGNTVRLWEGRHANQLGGYPDAVRNKWKKRRTTLDQRTGGSIGTELLDDIRNAGIAGACVNAINRSDQALASSA
jgi:hypothetical protein